MAFLTLADLSEVEQSQAPRDPEPILERFILAVGNVPLWKVVGAGATIGLAVAFLRVGRAPDGRTFARIGLESPRFD